jgi:uncharacterized protein DUF2017
VASEERFVRTRDGGLGLRLPAEEQELLRLLLAELRALLQADPDSPSLERLFPPAYAEEEGHESEYRRLVGESLLTGRLEGIRAVEGTIGEAVITEDELGAWLRTLTDLRLLHGTRLDVSQEIDERDLDPRNPRAAGLALYAYLTWLQEQAVEAAGAALEG